MSKTPETFRISEGNYIMEKLLAILADIRPGVDFVNEKHLIEGGVLDSFDIISIVNELNDAYDIDININH